MKSYLIESDLMQARAICHEGRWMFLAEDIMAVLGYPTRENYHMNPLDEGWVECLLDTAMGKQYCCLLEHRTIMKLYDKSPLDKNSKYEFKVWYTIMQRLLETEPGIYVPDELRWELETTCARQHREQEAHVMCFLKYWQSENDSTAENQQPNKEENTENVVQFDPLLGRI